MSKTPSPAHVSRAKGKPGRPRAVKPKPKQIQIRATVEEQALWARIGAARSAVAGVDLSQQQVFRWMMADIAERLGCAEA